MTAWRQTDFEGMLLFVGANVRRGSDVEPTEPTRSAPDDPYLTEALRMDHAGGGDIWVAYGLEPMPDRPGAYRTAFYVSEDPF